MPLEIPYASIGQAALKSLRVAMWGGILVTLMGLFILVLQSRQLTRALQRERTDEAAATEAILQTVIISLMSVLVVLGIVLIVIGKVYRRVLPPVAVRVDERGLSVWAIGSADLFLPWHAVQAVVASRNALHVQAVPKAHEVPGTLGVNTVDGRLMLWSLRRQGLSWRYLQAPPPQVLGQAVAHASSGRVQLTSAA
ncbi:hypothetical protein [Aestuariimicrobium ganziense]|uniref:hypothetical protein n=1 Tax=Aestuariimicrobium ganziense TaxID=2773677 RepID=UPI001944AB4C|nr:hypothetical protein [Aestuariimicrobium ganziense]